MSAPNGAVDAERTGRRVEAVLDRLARDGDPTATEAAEELVRALMDFYGAGLARVAALAAKQTDGPLAALLEDELVAGLLVLHGLHPWDATTRATRAVAALAGRPFEAADFDSATGTLRLRPVGGSGCGQTVEAAREQLEATLSCVAPEVTAVEVQPRQAQLLRIGPTRTRDADAEPRPAEVP
ncbi:hypothetical protein [Streptomyces sp. RPT161]|uniref:hypothetical protein n=1 Tax=Streptomyces sp. RPT161 TaxID=3015993 RepID=UPI0022B87267|nr:hypothetical protein [Streptomyces sp. RPT161]